MVDFVEQRVKEIISGHVDVAVDISTIESSTKLESMGVNSINFIRTVIELETEFDFQFDDSMLSNDNFTNIGDIVEYVKERASD